MQDFVLQRSDAKDRIRGALVDEKDRPLVGWTASVRSTNDGESQWSAWERTDDNGRFVAAGCPYAECTLEVFAAGEKVHVYPLVVVPRVAPGGDELRVVVPASASAFATIRGVVRDSAGRALRGAEVEVREVGQLRSRVWPTDEHGTFGAERLPPRRYELAVRAAGHPVLRLGEHTLAPRQQLDVGTLTLPRGGRLHVNARGLPRGTWAMVGVFTPEGAQAARVDLVPDRPATSDLLMPGRYEVRLLGHELAASRHAVEIVDGETATLELAWERGAPHHFDVREPRAKSWQELDLVVTDTRGHVVHRVPLTRRADDRSAGLAVCLGQGFWQVRASTDTGLAATADVHVTDVAATPPPVVLELR